MIRLFFIAISAWLLGLSAVFAQNTPLVNSVLDDDVRAVQLHLNGLALSLPIVDLNAGPNALLLEFDHLGDAIMDYEYTIVHCNSDWLPSELDPNEYINGYQEDRITRFEPSFNTLMPYTHYTLPLPTSNLRWTKSGNYLLKVWDSDDDDRLVLVRRFMVSEPSWKVQAQFVRTVKVSKADTHHEIDFSLTPLNDRVSNPQNDVKAFVLQNSRWDNAIGPLKPYISRGNELVYDYQDVVTFPAGQEFRFFDMRSFDIRGQGVRAIKQKNTYYEVTLARDESRFGRAVVFNADADGEFVIANNNANQTMLQCDYAEVLFAISQNLPFDDADVYVFGAVTDWQLKPEFRMKYDGESQSYYCTPFLKQGYYNYQYVVVNRETGVPDLDGLEGNWHQTGNYYTILAYFRPFGARYDRLVAASTIDYAKRN